MGGEGKWWVSLARAWKKEWFRSLGTIAPTAAVVGIPLWGGAQEVTHGRDYSSE